MSEAIDWTQVEQQSKMVKIMSTNLRLGLSQVLRNGYLWVYLGQYLTWVKYMFKSPDQYMTQVKVRPARPNPIIGLKGFFLQGQGFKTHVGKSNSMKVFVFCKWKLKSFLWVQLLNLKNQCKWDFWDLNIFIKISQKSHLHWFFNYKVEPIQKVSIFIWTYIIN